MGRADSRSIGECRSHIPTTIRMAAPASHAAVTPLTAIRSGRCEARVSGIARWGAPNSNIGANRVTVTLVSQRTDRSRPGHVSRRNSRCKSDSVLRRPPEDAEGGLLSGLPHRIVGEDLADRGAVDPRAGPEDVGGK